jgi:SAM-dependent methyltransferase
VHPSSLESMQRCYERHLRHAPRAHLASVQVLDLGGADVNGSYREVFSDARFHYIGADLSPGPGVSVVLDDPYRIPLDDASVDILICGQTFEHCRFFWRLFEDMARVVHPDGMIALIAPSAGPVHRHPVDCWRFYPDSMRALADYAGLALVDTWMEDKGPWNDAVGVFAHRLPTAELPPLPISRFAAERMPTALFDPAWLTGDPAQDQAQTLKRGRLPYLDVLARVHARLAPRRYLEIGVGHGRSLALARCPAVAIDPEPRIGRPLDRTVRLYRETSDDFFEQHAAETLADGPPDLVLIDGMHLFEFALRDFIQVERHAAPGTLVAVDDIFPNHPAQAERRRRTRVWTGDVWKLHACLREHRPDLTLLALDTEPSGLLLVAGLDPRNRVLARRYNPILSQFQGSALAADADPITRRGAIDPDHPRVDALLGQLRAARDQPVAALRQHLRAL